MMKRQVIEIAGVVLVDPLYVREYESPHHLISKKEVSGAGSDLVYVREIVTPEITLESKESGWVSQSDVDMIRALFYNYTNSFLIKYVDGTTEEVRAGTERESELAFIPLFECSLDYRVVIPLSKIL